MEWEPDSASEVCRVCSRRWGIFTNRRHHCRKCGKLVCNRCSRARVKLSTSDKKAVRTCDECLRPPPPPVVAPIEFVRAKTRIPFSDESPTLLGSPEQIFRKSLIIANSRVASVIEETEKSLLMDLSNATGNGANEAALLDAADDVPAGEGADSDSEVDAEGGDTPGTPAGTLLDVEELSSHWSVHQSQMSGNSPKSDGDESFATMSTEPTAALSSVKEGVYTKTRLSTGKDLKLSISKFGAMTFSEDERSAPPSTMSTYGSRITDFPLSPEAIYAPESATGFAQNLPVHTAENQSGETSDAAAPVAPQIESAANASEIIAPTFSIDAFGSDVPVFTDAAALRTDNPAAQNTQESPTQAQDSAKDNAPGITVNTAEPASPANPASIFSPIEKPKGRIVTKKTTPAPVAGKLTPGLSPLPPGNNVRRLSTLSLSQRSPYNSGTTPSTEALAAAAADASKSPSPSEQQQVSVDAGSSSAGVAIAAELVAEGAENANGKESTGVGASTTPTTQEESVATTADSAASETALDTTVQASGDSTAATSVSLAQDRTQDSTHASAEEAAEEAEQDPSSAATSREVSVDQPSRSASNASASNAYAGEEGFVVSENKKSHGTHQHKNRNRNLKKQTSHR